MTGMAHDIQRAIRADLARQRRQRRLDYFLFCMALPGSLFAVAGLTGNLSRLWTGSNGTGTGAVVLYVAVGLAPLAWTVLQHWPWRLGIGISVTAPVATAILLHTHDRTGSLLEASWHCSSIMLAGSLVPMALWALLLLPHARGWLGKSPVYAVAVSGYTGLYSFALIHTLCGSNNTSHTLVHLTAFASILVLSAFVLPRYIMAYWNATKRS